LFLNNSSQRKFVDKITTGWARWYLFVIPAIGRLRQITAEKITYFVLACEYKVRTESTKRISVKGCGSVVELVPEICETPALSPALPHPPFHNKIPFVSFSLKE
jgi:hypothetical protein